MSIMKDVIEEERLLHLSLWASTQIDDEEDYTRCVADELIVAYIIDEFAKAEKEEFTEEEVNDRFAALSAEFLLTKQVQDGLIDVDLTEDEPSYSLTEKGKRYAEGMGFPKDNQEDGGIV